jgi:hypothetical protein
MHDWALRLITVDWKVGLVSFESLGPVAVTCLVAHEVCQLHIPRMQEWGPSVSVNRVLGPTDYGEGLFHMRSR